MNDLKTLVVYILGALFSLLAPIHNFMISMMILFIVTFFFGVVDAIVNNEHWDFKKALMFFVYVAIFFVLACTAFAVGHYLNNEEQAIAVVKILCFLAVYFFGTNIFRNLCNIVPKSSTWYKFFDLCYYVLSIQFIERFSVVKKWQEERNGKPEMGRTILDKDNF